MWRIEQWNFEKNRIFVENLKWYFQKVELLFWEVKEDIDENIIFENRTTRKKNFLKKEFPHEDKEKKD